MHISIDALDSSLLLTTPREHSCRSEVKAGHWLHHVHAGGWPETPLRGSWTWQAVAGEGGRLLLRADGLSEQLVLTQDLADDLIIFQPSTRVFLADYLEVLSWWRACHWGPCLLDNQYQGDITVTADSYGRRSNPRAVGSIPKEDLAEPEVVWLHLVEMLYCLVHPGKAKGMVDGFDEKRRAAFIREMRRKVAKVGIS